MKNIINYFKIKWGSFLLTFILLSLGIIVALFLTPKNSVPEEPELNVQEPLNVQSGFYSNEAFAQLMESNLSELGFINKMTFEGTDEGQFKISGILCEPSRLSTLCPELSPLSPILNTLKDQRISIQGHLGENEAGYGKFISDTITFSGYTVPAGIATEYIEEYTGLNDLLEVPFREIELSNLGIKFEAEIPAAIQTASRTPAEPSLSEED